MTIKALTPALAHMTLAALAFNLAGAQFAERGYEMTAYSKPGAAGTVYLDISDNGTIVGAWSSDGFLNHSAGLVRRLGEETSVEVPESSYLELDAISSGGRVVGDYWNATFSRNTSFIRNRDGAITVIAPPGPDTVCVCPFGVNESGVIVGVYDTDPTFAASSAYILDDGVYSFFNHPNPQAVQTQFNGINNSGVVVGRWRDASHVSHPFVFQDGEFQDFEIPGAGSAAAYSINDRGQIGGYYAIGAATYGFLYDDGEVTTFDFGGLGNTRIFGLNNSGQMVGAVNFPGLDAQALVITPSPGRRVK